MPGVTVPPARQCDLKGCDREAVDGAHAPDRCELHIQSEACGESVTESDGSGVSDGRSQTAQESDTGDVRVAAKRAAYLAQTTGLRKPVAQGVAYRELGYSHSGIAQQCAVAETTVDGWMGRVAAQYGLRAAETVRPDEEAGDLEPITHDDARALSTKRGRYDTPSEREQWLAIAEDYRQYVPDDVELDAIAATVGGERR